MEQLINNLIDIYQSNENKQINYQIKFKNIYFNNNITKLCDFLKQVSYATSISFNKTDIKNDNFNQICEALKNNNSIIEFKLKNNIWLNDVSLIKNIIKNNTIEHIDFNFSSPQWNFEVIKSYEGVNEIFKSFSDNTSLKSIILSSNDNNFSINIPDFNLISKNTNLENLSISNLILKNNIINTLNENNTLTSLTLQNTGLNVDLLQPLIQKNSIYSFYIHHSNISNLQNLLLNNTSITDLNLSHCKLTDINNIIPFIQNNQSLYILNLSNNQFNNINPLSDVLKNNDSLYELNLSYNNINDINEFSNLFETNNFLQILNLSHNNISDVSIFSEKIRNNKILLKLDLSFNNIDIVQPLFNILKVNNTLYKLNLKNNNIHTITNLDEIFISNKTLTSLNLLNNKNNFDCLIDALHNNDTLTSLYLSYDDNISNDIPQKISGLLQKNTTLVKLSINFKINDIDNFLKFSEGLKTNTTLTLLKLNNVRSINYHNMDYMNSLKENSIKQLTDALKENKSINTLKIENFLPINYEINLSCLTDLIKNNNTLTSINIPSIDSYNYNKFIEALNSNTTLTKL